MMKAVSEMEVAFLERNGEVVFLSYPPKDKLYKPFAFDFEDYENPDIEIKTAFRKHLMTQLIHSA